MRIEWNTISHRSHVGFRARAVFIGCLAVLVAPLLMAQIAQAQQSDPPPAPVTEQREPRGLFEAIGRWFDQSTAGFRSHILGANRSFDELNQRAAATSKSIGDSAYEVTKDTVGAVAKLPMSRIVIGRERCALAPNGAPDCLAAAETLCRKQGYTTGKSVDFTSAENCPARTYLSGRQTEEECTTVTFISRAMCQ